MLKEGDFDLFNDVTDSRDDKHMLLCAQASRSHVRNDVAVRDVDIDHFVASGVQVAIHRFEGKSAPSKRTIAGNLIDGNNDRHERARDLKPARRVQHGLAQLHLLGELQSTKGRRPAQNNRLSASQHRQ